MAAAPIQRPLDPAPEVPPGSGAAAPLRTRNEQVATLLTRPLFAAGRKPMAAPPPAEVSETSLPRLTGIIASQGVRRAVFSSRNGQASVTAIEGDELISFRIVAIGNDTVELDGAGGRRTLRLETDQAVRIVLTALPPLVALTDPVRREAETENDQ